MKRMDAIVAAVLAAFSAYMMWKSTELPIGWIHDYGPGGGAFPFWLSAAMLVCTLIILVRTGLGLTPESQSDAPFFVDGEARRLVLIVGAALTIMIVLTSGIYIGEVTILPAVGVYVAIPLFMIFYMRYLGHHSWPLVLAISILTPVVTFLFFEKLLLILLPKGITDAWFYIFF
ncbi:MAG TPA: tripartite tricarboxylate transporter TctB family protein [bacterium]|nr:tripartite tricarboxylate transporter TctB family protein [bacterium]